ncbi:MAG: cupin domain-containing protein [Chloroflexota bacterium]|nr:cupin domain-containing protein [Chloroflexota bacterium]
MKIVKTSEVKAEEATSALFRGKVVRQTLIDEKLAKEFRLTIVNFSPGARNVFHTHTTDQVLYVIDGRGIVATEKEEHVVTPGMVAFIPAGERHWHGATEDASFSHVSITTPGQTKF